MSKPHYFTSATLKHVVSRSRTQVTYFSRWIL